MLCVLTVGAEEVRDTRLERPFAIGMQVLGPTTLFSGYAGYFLHPSINVELGGGVFGLYGGGKYYFGRVAPGRRWFPYAGAMLVVVPGILGAEQSLAAYIPIGLDYMFPWGLAFGAEAAAMIGAEAVLPYAALRVSFRF